MGRSFGAICRACGTTYPVTDGDIRNSEQFRCDACGKAVYVPRIERRRSEHLAKLLPPSHARLRREVSAAIHDEQHRIRTWSEGWPAGLPFAAGVVRRARARLAALEERQAALLRVEDDLLKAKPLPPLPACGCGGNLVRGGRIRCPACASTTYDRDRSVPELMVD